MDLYLRRVIHPQAHENYRVVLKRDEGEFEIGSIGIQIWPCCCSGETNEPRLQVIGAAFSLSTANRNGLLAHADR
jgi:hypothetical protein